MCCGEVPADGNKITSVDAQQTLHSETPPSWLYLMRVWLPSSCIMGRCWKAFPHSHVRRSRRTEGRQQKYHIEQSLVKESQLFSSSDFEKMKVGSIAFCVAGYAIGLYGSFYGEA